MASFLITRLGNVPINGRIKVWAVSTPPADYAMYLDRWEIVNVVRTLTAFLLIVAIAVHASRAAQPVYQPTSSRPSTAAGTASRYSAIGLRGARSIGRATSPTSRPRSSASVSRAARRPLRAS